MLSEEEKKAIERVEDTFYENKGKGINNFQKITLYEDGILDILKLLNIIEKLQKENKEKDEIIDSIVKAMDKIQDPQVCKYCDNIKLNHGYCTDAGKCKEGIKQYFERKVKNVKNKR